MCNLSYLCNSLQDNPISDTINGGEVSVKFSNNPYITTLRNKHTSLRDFRKASDILSHLLAQQVIGTLKTTPNHIETPLAPYSGCSFPHRIILVPILRSGLAMLSVFQHYFYDPIGFLGLKRIEETKQPHLYYQDLPQPLPDDIVIILDPMLATGGTAKKAVDILLKEGFQENNITFTGVICSSEGKHNLISSYSKIKTIIAAEDPELNQDKFIVPGLGDYGDRYFGTVDSFPPNF